MEKENEKTKTVPPDWELNPFDLQDKLSMFNMDMFKVVPDMEKEFAEIRAQRPKGSNHEMRNEIKRLETFDTFKTYSSWSPDEMANSGFYFTGIKNSIQCFCCGLVMCTISLEKTPHVKHQELKPECDFLKGKKVGNISKYELKVQRNSIMLSERQEFYKAEETRLESFHDWPTYAKADVAALASAGFFFTGEKDIVQCFCCAGSLAFWETEDDPWKEHAKWFPECTYLRGKKSSQEIAKYAESYNGFPGVTATHYFSDYWKDDEKLIQASKASGTSSEVTTTIFQYEDCRLDSFQKWPDGTNTEPQMLAEAGFFYTGIADAVQCFKCGIVLSHWEPGDVPWVEHAKHNPSCPLVIPMKNRTESPKDETPVNNGRSRDEDNIISNVPEERSCSLPSRNVKQRDWISEARHLSSWLRKAYRALDFRRIPSFSDTAHAAVDLHSTFACLALSFQNRNNEPERAISLPSLLRQLGKITVIEGEIGSGKTALLRKIAILWASGGCPVLQRFKLVFYVSLKTVKTDQSLAEMIEESLQDSNMCLNEESFRKMIYGLRNQVLFLWDDYGITGSPPGSVNELVLKNHMSQTAVVIGVQMNRTAQVRRCASLVVTVKTFPVYSTVFLLKNLFSHNKKLVKNFFINLGLSQELEGIFKTPLFALTLCALWVQDPSANMDERKIFEAYLHYTLQKPRQESVKVAAVMSSCGDLALEGLFTKQFEFTEESLWDAGIDSGDVLALGLMSKFTTQMLFPVYKFFHVSFQEYLAAKRLSDHFESDTEEQLKRGWCYLAQINTYFKVMFDYQSFLSYACSFSATTTEKIVRHLFSASESQDFFESRTENMKLLEKHPQHLHNAQMVRKFLHTSASREIWREHFLEFTIKISLHSSCLPSCAPHILQYLSGKSQFAEMGGGNAIEMFFNLYPQSLSLLSDVVILITGFEKTDANHFLKIENALKSPCQPSVEEDYAPAFQLLRDVAEMNIANERKIDHIQSMRLCHLSETTVSTLVRVGQGHTLPLLKIKVSYLHRLADGDRVKLQCLFTVFHSVELILESAEGFLESIQDVIEQNWANFRRLAFSGSHLTRQEEDLVLSMSSLEHLDLFSKKTPEFLISNLDKLSRLKEQKVTSESKVLDSISDGFKHLQNLDAFTLKLFDSEDDTSKLAFLLRHFPNLKHISLRLPRCPNFNEVTAVLSTCRKLEHIHFEHFLHFDRGVSELASALPKFENVKVLNLETQDIQDKESARIFAQALGSLVNLQELHLPLGNGMKAALPTVLEQLQHIRQLQVLTIGVILEDHSLYQLAKLSKESFLQSVQKLDLEINHGVTDAGWRDFFQTLDNLPHLKDLLVSRHYSQTLKPHASTVRAFVQCVSRLPSLMLIVMYGWLLGSEDLNMFNQMKRQHPQSQCLKLIWQWVLPFSPQILRETF